MQRRALGNTGVSVSELGLGTCFMSGQGQQAVNQCVARAVDRGIDYFDTAADYGKGNDERMLGMALRGCRDKAFLATKVGCVDDPGGHHKAESLIRQFEDSLRRLQTDRVDLLQLHEADQRKWWTADPMSVAEAADHCGPLICDDEDYDFLAAPCVEFLQRVKKHGKARFIGITGKDARRLARIVRAIPVDGMMIAHQYNPIYRNAVEFLLPLTDAQGVGVVGGAMLMKGWLAVPKTAWRTGRPNWMDDTFQDAYVHYLDIQASSGIPMPELTLRWLLPEKRLSSIVVGFSGWPEIEANIAAIERGPLPSDIQADIDAIGIVHPLLYQGRTTI